MIRVENLRGRKDAAGVYVGRPARGRRGSPLANPFHLGRDGDRAAVMAAYERWFREKIAAGDAAVVAELDRLAAQYRADGELTLLCWCAPEACHGEILAREVARRAKRSR